MRTGEVGVAPVSARGLLFLFAFVAFLALSVLGPHAHGVDSTPAVAAGATEAVADVAPVAAAESTLRGEPGSSGDQTLGFGAVCVLVLVVSIALLAVRGALGWAPLRRSAPRWLTPPDDAPRGNGAARRLLLSVSRT